MSTKRRSRADSVPQTASVSIGHWTDHDARTGCTVILFDRLVPTVVDVRGGAPGTRETDLLRPDALVRAADAIVLSGGSAPGLASVDGVVRFLQQRSRGFETRTNPVPIVPGAIIYDLAVGKAESPDARGGFAACLAADNPAAVERGQVGAGTGASTGALWRDRPTSRGGFGMASVETAAGRVTACIVVNASGAVVSSPDQFRRRFGVGTDLREELLFAQNLGESPESTTIGVVYTDAQVDYRTLSRIAISAHDGLARAIRPIHTIIDGDVIFASGLKSGECDLRSTMILSIAAEIAIERAVLDAVSS